MGLRHLGQDGGGWGTGWQLNVDLTQLVRHWPEDLEVLVSNPTGGNF